MTLEKLALRAMMRVTRVRTPELRTIMKNTKMIWTQMVTLGMRILTFPWRVRALEIRRKQHSGSRKQRLTVVYSISTPSPVLVRWSFHSKHPRRPTRLDLMIERISLFLIKPDRHVK